ncbi:MAG: penicillin-binding protein [bacterium]|nr:penicillin-binding protein [bacterium]
MKKKVTIDTKLSSAFIIVAFFVFVVIIGRISYLALSEEVDGINLQEFASKRINRTETLYAKRGSIFDVNGNVLAQNVSSYTVIAYLSESRTTDPTNPKHVVDVEYTAKKLSEILDIDYDKLLTLLSKDNVYQTELGNNGRGITEITKEKIEELKLPGIDFIETQKRNYPYGRFLSYTLGYAKINETINEDGITEEKIVGELGIEAKYNKELCGIDGYNFYQKDRNGYKIAGTDEVTVNAKDGNDIYLTVDATIQLFVEQALSKVQEKYSSEWTTIMMADAKSGAILASSTYPSFDPNIRDITNYLDYNVSLAYEPGSTMKIYSYMAAMENGTYNGSEKYKSGVYATTDGTEIGDWNRKGWGNITFDQGFALSSNVGVINLIKRHMDANILKNYYNKLGFGSKTGIELSNEVSGKINFKYETEILNAGFGQGITTTPIQNIKALTAISNDGILLKPYIIDKIVDQDTGNILYKGKKEELGRVASIQTVNKIKDLMESVVTGNSSNSTGYYYFMDGYDLIAKTGTAQVPKTSGNGYSDKIIRGFAGMFPKDNPRVIIYAASKNPTSAYLLRDLIKEVVKNTSNYLNIYNESKTDIHSLDTFNLPSYINKNVDDSVKQLSDIYINTYVIGNGNKIINQYPIGGTQINKLNRVFLVTNSGNDIIPDFTNLSESEATILANLIDINVIFIGTGYVESQSIPKDSKIDKSKVLELRLIEKK